MKFRIALINININIIIIIMINISFIILSMITFVIVILLGSNTIKITNEWISVGVTYGVLSIGCVLFGLALTL